MTKIVGRFLTNLSKQKNFSLTMVILHLMNVIYINITIVLETTYRDVKDDTPRLMYLWCSMSYMGAMLASNMALRFVNYPTQVSPICLMF